MLRDDLLIGAKAAAEYIGASPRMIYHMTERGTLPCSKRGKRLFFRKSELEATFRSKVV